MRLSSSATASARQSGSAIDSAIDPANEPAPAPDSTPDRTAAVLPASAEAPAPALAPHTASRAWYQADGADAQARCRVAAEHFDSALHAAAARFSAGLSPVSLALAALDWGLNLALQPAQAARLALNAQLGAWQWAADCLRQLPGPQLAQAGWPDAPAATTATTATARQRPADGACDDPRFAAPQWQAWPYAPLVCAYHSAEAWWADATHLRGMQPHHREMARVFARQTLDWLSPANAGLANPEVLNTTLRRQGANLLQGWANALDDWRTQHGLAPMQPQARPYLPGVDVAVTPGQVVYRNALVELIQYHPRSASVAAEPVFIVPSWIMKYYILDLSPENSLVKWLVEQGHTVFILSWRNPDEGDALLDMADYLQLGVFDALAAIARLLPGQAVHACGYCLGGTLLAIGAAALARPQQVQGAELLPPLASLSLLAAETDFSEPGEMGVLIDEAQVALLEDMMAERGFLTGRQMAGSFQFLHSRELVWSARLHELWLGERLQPNDLMAWNADVTRMPAAQHSEYLRRCYLRNELAESRYPVEGRPVSLEDIRLPIFAVGTEKDHVSPWKSVYKLHRLTETELTFVLTSGGHNAGIVSEPGHARRHYALRTQQPDDPWLPPEDWPAQATHQEGSWWPAWHDWLRARSSGRTVAADAPGRSPQARDGLPPAPGDHVRVRYAD